VARSLAVAFVPLAMPFAAVQSAVAQSAPESVATGQSATVPTVMTKTVTIALDRVPLKRAVKMIASSANVRLSYQAQVLDDDSSVVTLHVTNLPLGVAFDRVLRNTNLRAEALSDDLVTIKTNPDGAAIVQGGITGTVLNAQTKAPLRDVTVSLDDAKNGVVTREDGTFRLSNVSAGSHSVRFRRIGYERLVKTVTVTDGEIATVSIVLAQSTNQLEQVVVTGTVIPTEIKAIPNAMTVITAKDIEQRGITQIQQLFRGGVPGMFAANINSGNPLGQVTMFSRGATALSSLSAGVGNDLNGETGTNPIKTYVDGVELANPLYLSQIDPTSIERIEILTGPQASTIYGSNALNGVMQIFTKRGASSRPQLMMNLSSGLVQSDYSSAITPQHDDDAQLSGVEGRVSYNAGGSWNYVGAWTPAMQSSRLSGFGGGRIELPTPAGRVNGDFSLRRGMTQNQRHGDIFATNAYYQSTGWYSPQGFPPNGSARLSTLEGQTLGSSLGYAPFGWWSHELVWGQDQANEEVRGQPAHFAPYDTSLDFEQVNTERRSLRYSTTANVPVTTMAHLTVTAGVDGWQSVSSVLVATPQTLSGTLDGSPYVSRQPGHNRGAFVQTQVGFLDKLFFTYGARAEWNPDFGKSAEPNFAPRYGVSYAQDIGPVTAKARLSYGRSTRPPSPTAKRARTVEEVYGSFASFFEPYYGKFNRVIANSALAPEYQQGGEGGIDLYLGTRASLTVTRYNQTVDALITQTLVDSVRSNVMHPGAYNFLGSDGYGYMNQYENLNIGSIRNQGWELQGTTAIGPLTTKGTYSWTKSRVLGIDPRYRFRFPANRYPFWQPGASFRYLPEHTWALGITYAHARATVALNISGIGELAGFNNNSAFVLRHLNGSIRIPGERYNVTTDQYGNLGFNEPYTLADLSATYRLVRAIEGVVQVQNLNNVYQNDYDATYATMGRQSRLGLRIRL